MEVIYKILNGLYPSYLNDIIMLMNFKNDCVKLGSWCQGLVQYVMDRKVYDIYHSSYGTHMVDSHETASIEVFRRSCCKLMLQLQVLRVL